MSTEPTPKKVCLWCDGTGHRTCPACNDWGKTGGHDEFTCGNCDGSGSITCDFCS